MAVQLAKKSGATVYATGREANHPYIKALGADRAIDYQRDDFAEQIATFSPSGLDVVLDCVGGDTLKRSFSTLKKGGVLATICDHAANAEMGNPYGVKAGFVSVRPDGKQLHEIAQLFTSGKLQPPSIEEFPLEKVGDALKKSKNGHTKGKLVLKCIS